MSSSQALLNDIDLRYRNTFTTAQKLVWFNEEQRELFDILEIDSPPYAFTTVEGENFYPFPADFDVSKIKTVSIQVNDRDTPDFAELPFKRNDDNEYASYGDLWYTVVSNAMYLYAGQTTPADRTVYIYTDSDPTEVTTENISSIPDLPTKYQEILKLGVLKRIAGARKDIPLYDNFDAEREQKISDILFQRKMAEPEFSSAVDMMPTPSSRRGKAMTYGYGW